MITEGISIHWTQFVQCNHRKMARSLCLLALVALVGLCNGQDQSQCQGEAQKFHQCLHQNKPQQQHQPDPAIKQQMEQCFTNAGCTPPSGSSRGGRKGPGGRAGPPPQDNNAKCFQSVHQQLEGQFKQCLQQKGVNPPPQGGPGGKGQGGPGGPHGGPGGPGGPHGGPGGPHGGPPSGILAQQCNNDQAKADQVKACLQQLHQNNKPSREEAKAKYDAMCAAESQCKSQISQSCQQQLQKVGQAMCECKQQLKPQFEQAIQQESSCANVQKPPQQQNQQPHDCSKPPGPCAEGFEKFYEHISSGHGGPPPADGPQ